MRIQSLAFHRVPCVKIPFYLLTQGKFLVDELEGLGWNKTKFFTGQS